MVHPRRDHLHLLVHRWLYDVLLEPRGAVGCDGERRHLMREIPSGQLHVGEERRNAIGVDGRSVVRQQMLGVAPTLVVCLVLALVLVTTVGEFDQQRLLRSRQHLAVEHGDDFIALFPRFHPGESDSSALAASIAQYSGGDDRAVLVEHVVEVLLGDVSR